MYDASTTAMQLASMDAQMRQVYTLGTASVGGVLRSGRLGGGRGPWPWPCGSRRPTWRTILHAMGTAAGKKKKILVDRETAGRQIMGEKKYSILT